MKQLLILAAVCAAGPASAGLLDGLLPPGVGAAQNRCLAYGFRKDDHLARCTEIEMRYDAPKSWKLGEISRAQDTCMILGYRDDKLAGCVQRNLRDLQ